jgi:hypothetical protein
VIAVTRTPPRKQPGQARGPRRFEGEVLDVAANAAFLGTTCKTVWSLKARKLIPYRKLGGRVIFLRSEMIAWLGSLPGVTLNEALSNMGARNE